MSEHKDVRDLTGAPPSRAAMWAPPPSRAAPSPPTHRKGKSKRTHPPLSETLAAMQDLSFDASWKRAKDLALRSLDPYRDVSLPTNQKEFLSRNNSLPREKIDYNKFGKSFGKHRARHNLVVAHDFFPLFYEKLKKEIEKTLDGALKCGATLGMQGTATQVAQSEAEGYRRDAIRYGAEATNSREKMKKAVFDAQVVAERADKETRKTMEERQERDREAQLLVEMQAQAAKAMNEENAELRSRNIELEKENIKLKGEMQMIQEQSIQIASQNAELMRENSEIRERASSTGNLNVGRLSLGFGSGAAPKAPKPKATGGREQGWGWRKKPSSNPKKKGTKGGKRKRTRKKCNNRRLKKKMLCVRGTKKRLKKLKKYTKRLKLKFTRCSKQRVKNWSVRKKRKYNRRK